MGEEEDIFPFLVQQEAKAATKVLHGALHHHQLLLKPAPSAWPLLPSASTASECFPLFSQGKKSTSVFCKRCKLVNVCKVL